MVKCFDKNGFILYNLRGRQQSSFVPVNSQLTAMGRGMEVVVCKSMAKDSTTISYIVIKITLKKCILNLYNINIYLKFH